MELWYALVDLLPFDWAQPGSMYFMKNALLAVLVISPLFGVLSTMVVHSRMSFFSDALGHSAFTGMAIGAICGFNEPTWAAVLFAVVFALLFNLVRRRSALASDTVIGVFSSTAVALGIFLSTLGGRSFTKFNSLLIGDILSVEPEKIALLAGILLSLVFLFLMGKVRGSVYLTNVGETCNKGCQSAVSAIMNTAAAVGFGSVVKITPGFAFLSELVLGIGGSPLIAESIAINVLAGATGSASGGLQIALDALADNFIQMSQTSGIPLAVFHRVGSIACGGLDTLPWNGTVVMLFALSGVSYKKGYKHVAMETVILPLLSLIPVFIYYSIVH